MKLLACVCDEGKGFVKLFNEFFTEPEQEISHEIRNIYIANGNS